MDLSQFDNHLIEVLVYGRKNHILEKLWDDKNHGLNLDTKLVYQDGALLCHRLPLILASPYLASVITTSKSNVVHLSNVSLVEAHYFLKVIYGQPFALPGSRLSRLNYILEHYGVDRLDDTIAGVRERRNYCHLPELPEDINKQIILPPYDFPIHVPPPTVLHPS